MSKQNRSQLENKYKKQKAQNHDRLVDKFDDVKKHPDKYHAGAFGKIMDQLIND